MRILFLTSELPYPPDSGGRIKTLSLIDHLGRRHEVQVVCFRRQPLSDEQSRWAAQAGDVQSIPLNRSRSLPNLARSHLAGVPLSIWRNRSERMRGLVARRLADLEPDAVFVDGWLMAQYLPEGSGGLRLLHELNAEYVMWGRQAQIERNPLRRLLLQREYERVRVYEAQVVRRFEIVFAVSEPDRRALLEWVAQGKVALAIAPSDTDAPSLIKEGVPMGMLQSLEEGSYLTASFGSMVLINRAPHPNAAKVYINWLLSKEGQTAFAETHGSLSRRSDMPVEMVAEYSRPIPGVQYDTGNYKEDAVKTKDKLVETLKKYFK